jgi:hypothetical protein
MRVADLSPELRERISRVRWDRMIEKHEGPWDYRSWIEHGGAEFLTIDGFDVLLPVEPEHHPNITIVRCIVSEDRNTLTIFLKDTTWYDEEIFSGFLAVCDRFPGESWYLAMVYHEWFITVITGA